ncbi:MAG: rod shape-determining protein MreD, partial [Acetobacteraceae bacterium]|nr:rod shape-determining protein MreD [Acetobacteraceae bacterium]
LLPAATTAALLALAPAAAGLPGVVPAVALPCVYFWSVFRPAAMPSPAVFALGLLVDLLAMGPFGAGTLILLLAHAVAVRWRGFLARQGFLVMWVVFCAFAAGSAALGWGLQALLGLRAPPLAPGLAQAALTAGLYPAIALGLTWLHGAMREAEATP